MKKLLFAFVLTLLSLIGLSSCTDEAFDVDTVNKQTILVFMPWSGSSNTQGLTHYLSNNIDSICQGIVDKKGLNNTRVLVFFSESAGNSTLYDLQYDATLKSVSRVPIKTYEGSSYNSAEGFASILGDVKANAETLNYALIIGGHGAGWTYADDWQNYPVNAKPYTASQGQPATPTAPSFSGISFGTDDNLPLTRLHDDDSSNPQTRFFGSVSRKENSIDVTTLAEGIKMSGIKMQYILFDACYMGNVETAYELKDVTNYLVSSSSEIMAAGIPYRTIWSSLNGATPSYSSIVASSINYYKNSNSPYLNLAAIDCRQLDDLASVMKEINDRYTLSASIPLDSIQPLDGFTPHLFYDLGVYVDSICPVGVLKDRFNSQLKKVVKSSDSTEKIYSSLSGGNGQYYTVKSYSGLSISDPSQHAVAIRGREKTGWWKATH